MFWIKKLVALLLSPLAICLGVALAGLLMRWRKQGGPWGIRLVVISVFGVLAISCGATGQLLLAPLESQYSTFSISDVESHPAYVVVLGGGYNGDDNRSTTAELAPGSTIRFAEGLRIHRAIEDTTLVVSGAAVGESRSTAEAMGSLAEELGVPAEEIIVSSTPRDTAEEAEAIAGLVGDDDTIVLVTSASHMPRAMHLFDRHQIDAVAAPTHHLTANSLLDLGEWWPSAMHVRRVERAVYEYVALLWVNLGGS